MNQTPPFPEFYRAVNGRDPFPWQSRLAEQVAKTEAWPTEVGIPTGLGKTACLDIAIWWLASQADRSPADRTAPTRIWWIVNRRLLVDSTTEHAKAIGNALSDPHASGVVAAIADRLHSLSADTTSEPLEIIRLRGGVPAHSPADPSRPAVILSTLPMYGSRLLFRGYGVTRSMRPIEAAMAGIDSLVLLDEAHLAPHLVALLPALSECHPDVQPVLHRHRSRPTIVALTATGDATSGDRFDLDDKDEANPIVRRRLDAMKVMEVRVQSGDSARRLAEATQSLVAEATAPSAFVVFVNSPATARLVFGRLRETTKEETAEILLLTGRARERESERTRQRILDPVAGMASTRDPVDVRQRHLIVVATQTLEVGADIDADFLVTEQCGVRALTQRLGRLNRLGRNPRARAIYVHLPPPKNKGRKTQQGEGWPVYGGEPAEVLRRLEAALLRSKNGTVNLSPRLVANTLGEPGDNTGRAPEILTGLLWEWVKTTTPPEGEALVEPYFSGIAAPDRSISLIWRVYVPERGQLLWPRANDRESVEVPLHEAREAFADDDSLRRVGLDGMTIETILKDDLRPGDVIVLPTERGLLDQFGWDPASTTPVADASISEYGVPLDGDALRRLCGTPIKENLINRALGNMADDADVDEDDQAEATRQIVDKLRNETPPSWEAFAVTPAAARCEWAEFMDSIVPEVVVERNGVARLVRKHAATEPLSDELDEMSRAETAVELERHGEAVAARSRSIAERLGISAALVSIIELSGRFHDLGKADRRFQRWLDPEGQHQVMVAKSGMRRSRWSKARIAAGWPRGGRHEELSARLVRRWLDEHPGQMESPLAELLVHLVTCHHGQGRPLLLPADDGTAAEVSADMDGKVINVSADLSAIDWSQPARFRHLNDRFGPWGLALLEAIVRQADHSVSAGARVREMEIR